MSNVEIVTEMYAAFLRGDFDTLYASLDAEIEWAEPELDALPYPGLTRGREAVANQVFPKIGETYERLEFHPEQVIDGGDVVTVLGRAFAKGPHHPEETFPFAHVMRLREGRVVRFDHFVDTHRIARTLAGPGQASEATGDVASNAAPRAAATADETSQEPLALVSGIYEAFERGDFQAVLAACDPEIEWIANAEDTLPWSRGVYHGREGVGQYFADFNRYVEDTRVEVEELLPSSENVVAIGYIHARPHGADRDYRARFAQVWTVRNNKAVRLQGIVDTMAVVLGLNPGAAHVVDEIRAAALAG
jgi:ketosteroid isomerase-like protein